MFLKKFVNKEDFLKLQIIEALFSSDLPISYSDILGKLGISKFLLNKSIDSLHNDFQDLSLKSKIIVNIRFSQNYIDFHCEDDALLQKLQIKYIEQSLSFQILYELFPSGKYSIDSLSLRLNCSNMTIRRCLDKINHVLSSISLHMKSGELVGNPTNKYLLYYQLFILVQPKEIIYKITKEQFVLAEKMLDTITDIPHTTDSIFRLGLWIEIIKHMSQFQHLDNNLRRVSEIEPSFKKILALYTQNTNSAKLLPRKINNVAKLIYYFILSVHPFNLKYTKKNITSILHREANKIDDFCINSIYSFLENKHKLSYKPLSAHSLLRRCLTQLHIQVISFNGNILYSEFLDYLPIPQYSAFKNVDRLITLISTKIETDLAVALTQHALSILSKVYLTLLVEIISPSANQSLTSIGVLSYKGTISTQLLLNSLGKQFSTLVGTVIEVAIPNKKYSLLITDSSDLSQHYIFEDLYIIKSPQCSLYDFQQLKNKILSPHL